MGCDLKIDKKCVYCDKFYACKRVNQVRIFLSQQMIYKCMESMPSGRHDLNAEKKLQKEYQEFLEFLGTGDSLGLLLEAADCYYYHLKCMDLGIPTSHIMNAVFRVFTEEQVAAACLEKYTLRSQHGNPKNDKEERLMVGRRLSLMNASTVKDTHDQ